MKCTECNMLKDVIISQKKSSLRSMHFGNLGTSVCMFTENGNLITPGMESKVGVTITHPNLTS